MALVRWRPFQNLTPYDPFREFRNLSRKINRMFADFPSLFEEEDVTDSFWSPAVDLRETDDALVLTAELPGMTRDDVEIQVTDNTLILKGEKKLSREVKRENYHRMERVYGNFSRSFTLPANVDHEKIKARFKDGVLEVTLPKSESAKPKQIPIETK